jgi:hexosaminidase
MNAGFRRSLLLAFLMAASGIAAGFSRQPELADFAKGVRLQFGVSDNFKAGGGFTGYLDLHNDSATALPAGQGAWRIYLHSIRKLDATLVSGLQVSHVQGDLHQIMPTSAFAGLAPGRSLRIDFTGPNWIVSASDFMPRTFITAPGLRPEIFANTDTERLKDFVAPFRTERQRLRQPDDRTIIATARVRYVDNVPVNVIPVDVDQLARRIFPTPKKVRYSGGAAVLDSHWRIDAEPALNAEAGYLHDALFTQAGLMLKTGFSRDTYRGKRISLRLDTTLAEPEAYRLEIAADGISVYGNDEAGVFYGVQSLLSLIPAGADGTAVLLPVLLAHDVPRYAWRGMHYDMARNFHGLPVTMRLIEQMGRYKLNKLHLHLSDDEGWRLAVPGLPELTEIGGRRCFDPEERHCLLTQLGTGPSEAGSGNGFYTRAEFISLLKFAAARHIEVIPEIDMPGHARAAVKAMQERYRRLLSVGKRAQAEYYLLSDPGDVSVYWSVQNYNDNAMNVCRESTYRFVAKIVNEIGAMYREAGLRMDKFHVGGDEVGKGAWQESPDCRQMLAVSATGVSNVDGLKQYFVKRVAGLLQTDGIAMLGWEDGLMDDATAPFARDDLPNPRVIANVWDNIWEWGVADRAYRLANAGYKVVLSHATHLYFDHPQAPSPDERGYYWATRFTDSAKVFGYMPDNLYANADRTRMGEPIVDLEKTIGRPLLALEKPENILGMQGQVWSETIRTPEQLEQMIYPRLLLMAERAWHKAEWEGAHPDTALRDRQWAETAHLLAMRELPKLQSQGISVYIPKPGVVMENGLVKANTAFPGMAIFFSEDSGAKWHPYTAPVPFKGRTLCFRSSIVGSIAGAMECVPEDD